MAARSSITAFLGFKAIHGQKRPQLILFIARELYKVRPDLTIDVYGGHAMEFDEDLLAEADLPNVTFHGPYDHFSARAAEHRRVVCSGTSLFDGRFTPSFSRLAAVGLWCLITCPMLSKQDESDDRRGNRAPSTVIDGR